MSVEEVVDDVPELEERIPCWKRQKEEEAHLRKLVADLGKELKAPAIQRRKRSKSCSFAQKTCRKDKHKLQRSKSIGVVSRGDRTNDFALKRFDLKAVRGLARITFFDYLETMVHYAPEELSTRALLECAMESLGLGSI